ncbi:MAG: Eco57I restriction-modification methylase domain-containing protein [Prevotella sp.]|nr:Eco57I restriction-modification methylase domain-containing protein [Prevotella sp.]
MATFESSLKSKLIYVFAINDERHRDCLKIGETTIDEDDGSNLFNNTEALQKAAHHRIRQYTKTAGIAYQLLYTEISIFVRSGMIMTFNDKQVHKVLERSGIKRKEFEGVKGADEWYCCDLETVKKAIAAVKKGETSLHPSEITQRQTPIIFRPEQQEAINKTRKRFKKGNQMLWNAKMRFGKTLSALQVVKEEEFTRTLILTHRPVVDKGWFEDFGKIFYDRPNFHYGSRTNGETFEMLESMVAKHPSSREGMGVGFVYFASMQDLRGSEQVGGKFDKNNEIFRTAWDFVIVDEAHEGTKTELGQNVLKELIKPDTKVLQLSGTPFNLFDDYSEEEVFTWDYVMEQKAKQAWATDNPYEPNPYASLPAINIYTYDLGTLMSEYVEDEKAFNFREFFRTKDTPLCGRGAGGEAFIHDKDVDRFLDLLCKDDKDSLYPYSNDQFRRIFRHTLWLVPGVKSARALSTKLKSHPVFGMFQIVNVAGNGDEDEENAEALQMVNKAIGEDPDETYTITLSCGRLTTGVSIKPWTAVFMMAGSFSTSAAQYMQTIFRVQTPFTNHGRMKEQCYAFDFAPDRTLRVLAETAKVSAKAGKQTEEDRRILGDFLNFCPIISIDGSKMKPYDVNKMMSQLKKAQIEKVVQCGFEDGALYNDELLKLTDVELHDFDELKKAIGSTKAMAKTGDIDVNNQGFTNEQYAEKEKLEKKKKKDLTPEEKARLEELKAMSNQRRNAISILRGISIRMPLLIYGAELKEQREQSGTGSSSAESRMKSTEGQLKDEDEEITINNFASLIDDQSWEEFMPKGVDKERFEKFKKYYDPDIFREAGKRIREMARAADKFTIEERIERIAAIFNTFRNPDKETVLTPWRVVNMHMSDCLGGWCFYDKDFKEPLSVPRYVEQGKVTKDVFRTDAHILEINSKSGLYPLYVAYNIYRARVEAAKQKYGEVSHGFAMNLWDATIEENILVVCKTPMAKSITKRTLAGFRNTRVNAQYYPDLIQNISERPEAVVNTFRDGKHFWKINQDTNMKLDAIVGNPPYQVMDGGAKSSAKPVYQHFVNLSKSIKPNYLSMIMPAKWFNGGKGLDDFRSIMLSDNRITSLYDFIDGHDCFPTVDIAGGICYFLWDSKYNGKCNVTTQFKGRRVKNERELNSSNVFIRHIEEISILDKTSKDEEYLAIYPRKPFGLSTDVKPTNEGDISLRYPGGIGPFKTELVLSNKDLIDKWKVITSYATAEHAGETDKNGQKRIISTLEILEPNVVCTETYLLVRVFDNIMEAENLVAYIKTRFVRCLIAMITTTQHLSRANFRFVPLQDFARPWTDADLYAKYNLTDEEIQFIESMIKPME